MKGPPDGLIACRRCNSSRWANLADRLNCRGCGLELEVSDGVVRLAEVQRDAVATYYDDIQGPHFVEASFESNPHVYLATRAYERHLGEFFRAGGQTLVDLGCGDGRFSLWALEHGFRSVVAVDRTLAPLRRLAATARARSLPGLIAVQASFDDPALAAGAFDAAFAIESFTYLGERYAEGLAATRRLLKADGRAVVSEFCRDGRLLADVVALNLENMREGAERGRRWEKSGEHRLAQRLFTVAELARECEAAGFEVVERRGISPVPMLFHYAWTFTSYPLRPPLDEALHRLLEALDERGASASDLARNTVLLLRKLR